MLLLQIVIILLLMVINGVFALSEIAIVSSRKARLATRGGRGAARALELISDPGRFLSTVQIGITLVGIVAGAFGGATIASRLGAMLDAYAFIAPHGHEIALTLVVVAITYLSLVVGELVPKRIALTDPERVAVMVAGPMARLSRIAAPAVWLLGRSTDLALKILGFDGAAGASVTEEEVRSLIAEGTQTGVFAPEERRMIDGVLRLADRTTRAIMTPRADIDWIDLSASREDIVSRLERSRHTHLLVGDGSIDHAVGLVDARTVLAALNEDKPLRLADIMRKVPVIPEQAMVFRLIELFRSERVHVAAIVDEYGSTQGIVTATDVLESIAGDLPEIGDRTRPMVIRRANGAMLIDGKLPIDEFEDLVGIRNLRDGDFDTLAGFVIDQFGHLPEVGEVLTRADMRIEVTAIDGRRVDRVLVTLPETPTEA